MFSRSNNCVVAVLPIRTFLASIAWLVMGTNPWSP